MKTTDEWYSELYDVDESTLLSFINKIQTETIEQTVNCCLESADVINSCNECGGLNLAYDDGYIWCRDCDLEVETKIIVDRHSILSVAEQLKQKL
ncbi:MAG: hypothetical protein ACYC5G_04350 [Candidatus Doudnabacteria bacterium]